MLLKLFLIVSLISFAASNRLEADDYREESGDDIDFDQERFPDGTNDVDDADMEASGDDGKPVSQVTVSINQRKPPSAVDKDEKPDEYDEEEENLGGAGIVIDENEGDGVTKDTNLLKQEPVHVQENSLITHPGIMAAIIIGGVLVLVCLIVFFVLVVCCVRKKDEGTYDLDDAMKQKLKYVAYTKAETSPDKEFFA